MKKSVEIKPAATVLITREKAHGIEVLMLKRNSSLRFAPSVWVFPGGRIDPSEIEATATLKASAIMAGVRETKEECGLTLQANSLQHYCHWTTPAGGPKRFGTWFFHTVAGPSQSEIQIDESEIVDFQWLPPLAALKQQANQQLPLLPPTLISLHRIKHCKHYSDLGQEFNRTGIIRVAPVVVSDKGLTCCLYEGDAGYQQANANVSGPRHRLLINNKTGQYQFQFKDCENVMPITGGVDLIL